MEGHILDKISVEQGITKPWRHVKKVLLRLVYVYKLTVSTNLLIRLKCKLLNVCAISAKGLLMY